MYLDIRYTEREEKMKKQGRSLKSGRWRNYFLFERLHGVGVMGLGPGATMVGMGPGAAISSL